MLTAAFIAGADHGKVHTAPWHGPRFSTGNKDLCARWYVFKLGDEKKFFPVVLTTGPEEILCSGRVGSRAPIRGPLPLLGSATGSQGPLRRMCLKKNLPVKIWKADWKVSAVSCSQFNRSC